MARNTKSFPDRIEAGTFLIAGAIAGKEVTVNRVRADHLTAVTDALQACGFRVGGTNGSLVIHARMEVTNLWI